MIFKDEPDLSERPDWQILQNGWTALYLRPSVLDAELAWFRKEGFQIAEMDCGDWKNEEEFHKQLKGTLNFPDYYGRNMNALNDSWPGYGSRCSTGLKSAHFPFP